LLLLLLLLLVAIIIIIVIIVVVTFLSHILDWLNAIGAVQFSLKDGQIVAPSTKLTFTHASPVYYTINGADPRLPGKFVHHAMV
jgi:predicted tellurium resistance membrane protein TerC